ncbi:hypothetical protein D3C73_1465260 [compost metagenome]
MATEASGGFSSGSTTRKNDLKTPQPSINAASSSSLGIVRKKAESMYTLIGKFTAIYGKITDNLELRMPRFFNIINSGISVA